MPASYDPTLFNVTPYYDDYDEDKKFHRLLFKPGYAVQARELTQIQTILQNQIERFGNHIFKEGSRVFGSEIVASDISYVRMMPTNTQDEEGVTQDLDSSDFVGKVIVQGTVNGTGTGPEGDLVKAKVVHAAESYSDNDPYTIFFVDYLQGSSFRGGETLLSEGIGSMSSVVAGASGQDLVRGGAGNTSPTDAITIDGITGVGKIVSVSPGIYYIHGAFVKNTKQIVSPFALTGDGVDKTVRYFYKPTNKIGFNLKQSIETSQDDFSLRDPSAGSYNYNAPGADRYKLDLDLVHTTSGLIDGETAIEYSDFIELMRFREGKITYKNLYTQYNELEKTLARRTYDESGNYTVKPFTVSMYEHLDDGTNNGIWSLGKTSGGGIGATSGYIAASLSAGKAYIFGHEFETQAPEYVDIRKARGADHERTLNLYRPYSSDQGKWFYATAGEDFDCLLTDVEGNSYKSITKHLWKPIRFWDGASADGMEPNPGPQEVAGSDTKDGVPVTVNGIQQYNTAGERGIGCASSYLGYGWVERIEPLYIGSNAITDDGKQVYKVYVWGFGRRRPWSETNYTLPNKSLNHTTRVTTRRWQSNIVNNFMTDIWYEGYSGNSGGAGGDYNPGTSELLVFNVLKGKAEWDAPRVNRVCQYSYVNRSLMFWNNKGNSSTRVSKLQYDFAWHQTITPDAGSEVYVGAGSDDTQGGDSSYPYGYLIFTAHPNGSDTSSDDVSYEFPGWRDSNGQISGHDLQHYTLLRRNTNDTQSEGRGILSEKYSPVDLHDETKWVVTSYGTNKTEIRIVPQNQEEQIEFNAQNNGNTKNHEFILHHDIRVIDNVVNKNTVASKKYKTITDTINHNVPGADPPRKQWNLRKWGTSTLLYLFQCDVHHIEKVEAKMPTDAKPWPDGITVDVTNDFMLYDGSAARAQWLSRILSKDGTLWSTANLASLKRNDEAGTPSSGVTIFANGCMDEWNIPDGATYPPLDVTYSYFEKRMPSNGGLPAPTVVQSYTDADMGNGSGELIPVENMRWSSPRTQRPMSLSSIVDFRYGTPYSRCMPESLGLSWKQTGAQIRPGSLKVEHNYLLPRVDKIILSNKLGSQNSTFKVLEGRPSETPLPPDDKHDSMTLYSVIVPPYTFNPSDIIIKQENNQRYTMKDIGNLDKKITAVEHFASLSLLEKDILSRQLFKTTWEGGFPVAVELYKVGILTDSFSGHEKSDVSKARDYQCSIDRENKILRPAFNPIWYNFDHVFTEPDDIDDNLHKTTDGLIMIKTASMDSFIKQNLASTSISINPFNLVNYLGHIEINPPSNMKMNLNSRPEIKTFSDGINDNWRVHAWGGAEHPSEYVTRYMKGFGTQWNDWESIWSGIELNHGEYYSDRGRHSINQGYSKEFETSMPPYHGSRTYKQVPRTTTSLSDSKSEAGMLARSNPDQITTEINGKIIDRTVVPYMEPVDVNIKASLLKPNGLFHCFFDDRNVNEYCYLSNGQTGPFETNKHGQISETDIDAGPFQGATSDISFNMPYGKFLSGEKLFRLINNEDNEVFQCSSSAEGIYYAVGRQPLNAEFGIRSTRPAIVQKQTVTSNKIVRDITARNQTIDTGVNTQWVDPLSQTFEVDVNDYPDGLFLDSVDLYFSKKGSYDPVGIEIRPLLNGRPHGSHTIPFSNVVKLPDEINADIGLPSIATNFKFSSPVYLPTGDFALVIKSNSVDNQLWAAEVGEKDITTNQMIDRQPYSGVLFQPQNSSVSEVNQNLDLMFTMNKIIFAGSGLMGDSMTTTSFPIKDGELGSSAGGDPTHLVRLNTNELIPHSCSIRHMLRWNDNDDGELIYPNENMKIDSLVDSANNIEYRNVHDSDSGNAANGLGATRIKSTLVGTAHVSPVIDINNFNLLGVQNIINEPIGHYGDYLWNERYKVAWGWTSHKAAARYISRRINFAEEIEANNLRVYIDVYQEEDRGSNVDTTCGVSVWAKYAAASNDEQDSSSGSGSSDDPDTDESVLDATEESQNDFDDNRWYRLELQSNPFLRGPSENDFDFRECEFRLPELSGENLIGTFAIKIVMTSNDASKPPMIKNLRAIALTDGSGS